MYNVVYNVVYSVVYSSTTLYLQYSMYTKAFDTFHPVPCIVTWSILHCTVVYTVL